jgi:hypothetical protein
MKTKQKPSGYWNNFGNLARELQRFVSEQSKVGLMPRHSELLAAKRSDLSAAIKKHGGSSKVASRLGLKISTKPKGYWEDFANVERELRMFIASHDREGIMPLKDELADAGLGTLAQVISERFGGYHTVAKRLDLWVQTKPKGYWDNLENVRTEILVFINEFGTPGVMPLQKNLADKGRSNLSAAISKHGGFSAVAKRLGLQQPNAFKPDGYWSDFKNLKQELLSFIQEYGTQGVMPTNKQMMDMGRNDLVAGIVRHGGKYKVARLIGLKPSVDRKPPDYWKDFENLKKEVASFIKNHGKQGVDIPPIWWTGSY